MNDLHDAGFVLCRHHRSVKPIWQYRAAGIPVAVLSPMAAEVPLRVPPAPPTVLPADAPKRAWLLLRLPPLGRLPLCLPPLELVPLLPAVCLCALALIAARCCVYEAVAAQPGSQHCQHVYPDMGQLESRHEKAVYDYTASHAPSGGPAVHAFRNDLRVRCVKRLLKVQTTVKESYKKRKTLCIYSIIQYNVLA